MEPISRRLLELAELFRGPIEFFDRSQELKERFGEEACDFRAGDPQEVASSEYVAALRRGAEATTPDWFAYTRSLSLAGETAAASLREATGLAYGPEHVTMTNGAIAAIAVCAAGIADPGDEILIVTPPHFLYEPLIRTQGALAVRVPMKATTFDLDVEAIERAISSRTRGVIVNTPHNPTGKIYPAETLDRLAGVLEEATQRNGRPVYLLADEAYRRILFDGRVFHPPALAYRHTLTIYTYGKTLLAPGMRLGYVAVHPENPDGRAVVDALATAQILLGWAFPNTDLQHALPALEPMVVDVERLQRKRDRMVEGLRGAGYETHVPEATFYLVVRAPIDDDAAFTRLLGDHGVLVMPGGLLELPGTFRISLTATEDMIERSLPIFERLRKQVG